MAFLGTMNDIHKALFTDTIIPVVMESVRLFPDALVIASGVYALLIQSAPFGVFFGSMLEASIIYKIIKAFATYVNITGTFPPTYSSHTPACRTGFTNPTATMEMMTLFGKDPIGINFPSPPIYMLSVASAYIFTTLNQQAKELQALGPAYSSRYYSSVIFLLMIIFLFIVFRLTYQCDGFGVLILSMVIGLIIGSLLVIQNTRLFGPQSVNLIGIPLLRNRTADGKKLYVCPK
jgi:hypothetical protein